MTMDTKRITKIVIWTFYIYIGLLALTLISTSMVNSFVASIESGLYYDNILMMQEAEAHDLREGIIALFFMIVLIFCIVTFLRWTYKSSQISHLSGAKDLIFSPGWSVGWYFIPIATLWKPFQAFKQIYQVSIQITDWKNVPIPSNLRWWWGLFIVSGIINNMLFRIYLSFDIYSDYSSIFIIEIIVSVMEAACCLIIIKIVKDISQRYNSDDFQAILSGSPSEEIPSVEPTPNESREESKPKDTPRDTADIYFDNRKNPTKKNLPEEPIKKESNEETSSKDVSSEVDDIFFDNRRKK